MTFRLSLETPSPDGHCGAFLHPRIGTCRVEEPILGVPVPQRCTKCSMAHDRRECGTCGFEAV